VRDGHEQRGQAQASARTQDTEHRVLEERLPQQARS